jgi:ketosteroid isomerase-like protein
MTSRFTKALFATTLALGLTAAGSACAQSGEDAPPSAGTPAPSGPNVDIAREFYDAFCTGDFATMTKLYSPDVKWKDTIFHFDDRAGTMGMWEILLVPKNGGKFTYTVVSAQGDTVVVHWLADYVLLGNKVHNDVMATLVIENGVIVTHTDVYSWANWAKQAFPFLGNYSAVQPIQSILQLGMRAFLNVEIAYNALMAPKATPEAATPATEMPPPSKTPGLEGALGKLGGR